MEPAEKPDLDSRRNIEAFVDAFYARLLKDERLAPIFLDVAAIDLDQHLPHIKDYWCKLLLGERAYQRHTMNIHRDLNAKRRLNAADFERWLAHFHAAADAGFSGPKTQRAKGLATSIATNMQASLLP